MAEATGGRVIVGAADIERRDWIWRGGDRRGSFMGRQERGASVAYFTLPHGQDMVVLVLASITSRAHDTLPPTPRQKSNTKTACNKRHPHQLQPRNPVSLFSKSPQTNKQSIHRFGSFFAFQTSGLAPTKHHPHHALRDLACQMHLHSSFHPDHAVHSHSGWPQSTADQRLTPIPDREHGQ